MTGTLEPFEARLAATVASWAPSTDEVRTWCSRTDAPVPAEVVAGWSTVPDVNAYVLRVDGAVVAYGETWTDDEEREVELARLIVAPDRRGQGLGRRLAGLLGTEARRLHPTVVLRLHPGNAAAQRSYTAAGFTPMTPAENDEWNLGQPVDYLWMRHAQIR